LFLVRFAFDGASQSGPAKNRHFGMSTSLAPATQHAAFVLFVLAISCRSRLRRNIGDEMIRCQSRRVASALLLALLVFTGLILPAYGKKRAKSVAFISPDWATAPAVRYSSLSAKKCKAKLKKRKIRFQPVRSARGVLAPVRILDGVGGVLYRTALPRKKRATNPHDVFDCRLVLALDDFSRILRKHDIDEVIIYSSWRPPSKKWPKGKLALRHPGAMAVDIDRLGKKLRPPKRPKPPKTVKKATKPVTKGKKKAPKNKTAKPPKQTKRIWLDVENDFNGLIGSTTCGPKARPPKPATPAALELRKIVCQAAAERLFTSILTPNYDKPHFNHFHFDLTPGVKWRIVR